MNRCAAAKPPDGSLADVNPVFIEAGLQSAPDSLGPCHPDIDRGIFEVTAIGEIVAKPASDLVGAAGAGYERRMLPVIGVVRSPERLIPSKLVRSVSDPRHVHPGTLRAKFLRRSDDIMVQLRHHMGRRFRPGSQNNIS